MSVEEGHSGAEGSKPAKENATSDGANKKANSYYYWHGHEKERAKVGDVAPMPQPLLLKREDNTDAPNPGQTVYPITKHSWCDGEKTVTVYIDTDIAGQETMEDGSLEVVFKKRSFTVSYTACVQGSNGSVVRRRKQLFVPLLKKIKEAESSSKVKSPSGQIVLRLVKMETGSWWELARKDQASGGAGSSEEEEEDTREE